MWNSVVLSNIHLLFIKFANVLTPQPTEQFCIYCSNTYGGDWIYVYIYARVKVCWGHNTVLCEEMHKNKTLIINYCDYSWKLQWNTVYAPVRFLQFCRKCRESLSNDPRLSIFKSEYALVMDGWWFQSIFQFSTSRLFCELKVKVACTSENGENIFGPYVS